MYTSIGENEMCTENKLTMSEVPVQTTSIITTSFSTFSILTVNKHEHTDW